MSACIVIDRNIQQAAVGCVTCIRSSLTTTGGSSFVPSIYRLRWTTTRATNFPLIAQAWSARSHRKQGYIRQCGLMTRVAAPWRQRRAAHTAVFVLAVAVAAAQLSTLVGAAAAPPLPVGTDPAMRAAADNRSHSTPSVPSPQPSPMRPEAQPTKAAAGRGNGANAPNHAMDADQPPAAGLSALEDLMKDGCFAPSSDLAAYNE